MRETPIQNPTHLYHLTQPTYSTFRGASMAANMVTALFPPYVGDARWSDLLQAFVVDADYDPVGQGGLVSQIDLIQTIDDV